MNHSIPILLYHDIESPRCPNEKTNPAARATVVQVSDFRSQMHFLYQKGYCTISLKDYFERRNNGTSIPPRTIVITFDDGHYSNYELAVPILREYGFNGTFFITANHVGQQYHLRCQQIREMSNEGMEISSHGLSHNYLPPMNVRQIYYELQKSQQILESILGHPVHYFAFPGGHYTRRVLLILRKTTYQGACSCLQGLNHSKTDPYLLRRLEIREKCSGAGFENMFQPSRIALYQFIDSLKRLLQRSVGLNSYSRLRSRLFRYYRFQR